MKSFSLVPTSEGPRREFKITWGLRAGYGPSGRIYDLEETIRAAHRWTRERDARAEPFLSGMFTRGAVVFAGLETEAAHDREPVFARCLISTEEMIDWTWQVVGLLGRGGRYRRRQNRLR